MPSLHVIKRSPEHVARRLVVAVVLLPGALALPCAADAATIAMKDDVLTFEAADGEQNTVDINRTSNGFVTVWGGAAVPLDVLTPTTCSLESDFLVWCDLPQRVVVHTGDESDDARSIDFPAETTSVRVMTSCSPGASATWCSAAPTATRSTTRRTVRAARGVRAASPSLTTA